MIEDLIMSIFVTLVFCCTFRTLAMYYVLYTVLVLAMCFTLHSRY